MAGKRKKTKLPKPVDIKKYRKKRVKSARSSRAHSGTILLTTVFLIFLVYLAGNIIKYINKPTISTTVVNYGSVDTPQIFSGIIIRDEKVYTSSKSGTLYFEISNNDHVKKGDLICSVRNQEEISKIESSLESLNGEILSMQEQRDDISMFKEDVLKMHKKIKNAVDNDIYNFINLNTDKLYALKDDIQKTINVRNQIYLTENKGSIYNMVEEKTKYETEIESLTHPIFTAESGNVYQTVDGFEERFNFENRHNLAIEQTKMKIEEITYTYPRAINQNENIFKIVKSNEWYIAAYIKNEFAEPLIKNYENNLTKTIYLDNNGEYFPIDTKIESISKGDKESYVLFKCTKHIIDFMQYRGIDFKLFETVKRGFKVPNVAIVDRTFLVVPNSFINGNEVILSAEGENKKVSVVAKSSSMGDTRDVSYVSIDYGELRYNDTIVKQDESETFIISETVTIKGVYKVNRGIAEFIKIPDNTITDDPSGYTIIEPSDGLSLNVQDRIVTDAGTIKENQIIN